MGLSDLENGRTFTYIIMKNLYTLLALLFTVGMCYGGGTQTDFVKLRGSNQFIEFEGATNDIFETKLVVTDPTADRTITFPDSSGTLVFAACVGISAVLCDTSPQLGGDLDLNSFRFIDSTYGLCGTNLIVLCHDFTTPGCNINTSMQMRIMALDQLSSDRIFQSARNSNCSGTCTNSNIIMSHPLACGSRGVFSSNWSDNSCSLIDSSVQINMINAAGNNDLGMFESKICTDNSAAFSVIRFPNVAGTAAIDFARIGTDACGVALGVINNLSGATLFDLNVPVADPREYYGTDGCGALGFHDIPQGAAFDSSIWRSDTNSQVTPPSTGRVEWNNVTQSAATELFIHDTNDNGADVSAFLALVQVDDHIRIQQSNDSGIAQVFQVSSTADNGTDFTFGVTNIEAIGGNIANNRQIIVTMIRAAAIPSSAPNFFLIMPTEWMSNGVASGKPVEFDSSGIPGVSISDTSNDPYVVAQVPFGRIVDSIELDASSARAIEAWEVDGSGSTSKGTGTSGTLMDIVNFTGTNSNGLMLEYNANSLGQQIRITRVNLVP